MENYNNIDTEILKNINLKHAKESIVLPIILLLAAAIMSYLSIAFIGSGGFTYGIVFICSFIAIYGIKGIILPKKVLKFDKTGEFLKREEYFYDADNKNVVCNCIENNSVQELLKIKQGQSGRIKVICYSTPTLSMSFVQAFEYVPHEYVPICSMRAILS